MYGYMKLFVSVAINNFRIKKTQTIHCNCFRIQPNENVFMISNTTSVRFEMFKCLMLNSAISAFSGLDCNFEQADLCGYVNIHDNNTDNFDWFRASGLTGSQGTGPSNDHTYGTAAGMDNQNQQAANLKTRKCLIPSN